MTTETIKTPETIVNPEDRVRIDPPMLHGRTAAQRLREAIKLCEDLPKEMRGSGIGFDDEDGEPSVWAYELCARSLAFVEAVVGYIDGLTGRYDECFPPCDADPWSLLRFVMENGSARHHAMINNLGSIAVEAQGAHPEMESLTKAMGVTLAEMERDGWRYPMGAWRCQRPEADETDGE